MQKVTETSGTVRLPSIKTLPVSSWKPVITLKNFLSPLQIFPNTFNSQKPFSDHRFTELYSNGTKERNRFIKERTGHKGTSRPFIYALRFFEISHSAGSPESYFHNSHYTGGETSSGQRTHDPDFPESGAYKNHGVSTSLDTVWHGFWSSSTTPESTETP